MAREIHALSPRAEEPFVAVNIGAVHDNLMESELFGHEKGAFTGADSRKIGLFELAGSGSLFLDEIGEMPLPLQVKLLRVLQERKIRRLGGTRDIPVAARILSATNKDIETIVREGSFREDLYYRLNVVRVAVPPLRERPEDIPLLAGFLLEKLRSRMGKPGARLGKDALGELMSYSFPGNVRELENILERALIYAEGDEILPSDLNILTGAEAPRGGKPPSASKAAAADEGSEEGEAGGRGPFPRRDGTRGDRAGAREMGRQQDQGRRGARHQPEDHSQQDQALRPGLRSAVAGAPIFIPRVLSRILDRAGSRTRPAGRGREK